MVAGPAVRVESRRLQHGADRLSWVDKLMVVTPADESLARRGPDQAEQHAQRGGRAGAVRTEEAGHPPRRKVECEVAYGPYRAEVLAQRPNRDRETLGTRHGDQPGQSVRRCRP